MIIISQTPTISTSAYTSGDAIGGLMTFSGYAYPNGLIHSVSVLDRDGQAKNCDLALFSASFTATADNAAFALQTADEANLITVISVSTWYTLGSKALGQATNLSIPFDTTSQDPSEQIVFYGQLIARDTPTYTGTSKLTVSIGVLEY